MLLPALVLVLFGVIDGAHTHKGMRNSLELVKHMREMNPYQSQMKQIYQIAGTILDKESVAGVSLRKNFYNQIIARSCGASACCSKKGGICMTNDQPCPGEVRDLCMGDSCICCIPKCSCTQKCRPNRRCTRKGGTCITANQTCNGKLRPRLCTGGSCSCCIPVVPPTPAPTTTTDCIHDDIRYSNGDVIYIGCAQLRCENKTAVPTEYINSNCTACQVYNDPHFRTFEGMSFNWHQHCNFSLVQNTKDDNPDYAVYGDFRECSENYKRGACVTHTVIMDHHYNTYRFYHRNLKNVIVNGVSYPIPSEDNAYKRGDTLLWKNSTSGYIRVLMGHTLYVEILYGKINIWAPPSLEKSLYGLCRFQGGKSSGYYGSIQELAKINKRTVKAFALSWRTLIQENDICSPAVEDPDLCAGKTQELLQKFRNMCNESIGKVAPHLDVDTMKVKIESCVQDLCVCKNETACLDDISSMAENDENIQNHMFTPPPGGCGSPYFEVQDKLVQVCKQQVTQAKAHEICREGDGDLISLEKKALFTTLVERPELGMGSSFWVNGHYSDFNSSYIWTSGAKIIHNWRPNKPSKKRYPCVTLEYWGMGTWGLSDMTCKKWTRFICVKDNVSIKPTTSVSMDTTKSLIISTTESSDQCVKPFINLGGECFYISKDNVSWFNAQENCLTMSAVLKTPGSTTTNALLKQQELYHGTFWVGGRYDEWHSSYRWLTGELINYGWQTGRPKHSAKELCVAFESQGRGLIDWNCTNVGQYVCKQGCPEGFFMTNGTTKQCLKYFKDQPLNWTQANKKCQDDGLVMAKPYDPVSLSYYLLTNYGNYKSSACNAWVGAHGNGHYITWSRDGQPMLSNSTLWHPENRSKNVGLRYCLRMNVNKKDWAKFPDHPYYTVPCSDARWYALCEMVMK